MLEHITRTIEKTLGLSVEVQEKIVLSLFLVFLLWLVRFVVIRIIRRRTDDVKVRYQWRKTTFYLVLFIGILLVGRIWTQGFQSLSTYLGLVSAGIAIALKDLVASIAGWVYMITRKPIGIGDRIQLGSYRGDVIDIRLFKFTLMEIGNWVDADQSTGRVIHLPNMLILTETLANYSKGFEYIWEEIPVLITFESNWEKAKKILTRIAEECTEVVTEEAREKIRRATRRFMIYYTRLTPAVYTSVKDSGVLLTLRFLCEPRKRRGQGQKIWECILREFAGEPDIDFAYPTTRFYDNPSEGRPGIRPPGTGNKG
jgi:small-conductance mechanosensitive channel